jgi:hypothetical protein
MSIWNEIAVHVQQGALIETIRRDLRATVNLNYRRWVYVSSAIDKEISKSGNAPTFRKFSAQLQSFIIGRTVPVALKHDHKIAEWARLDPPGCEVWEARIRHVKPELRVLGRFADVDIFIALNLYEGGELKKKKDWDNAKARCQTDWAALFPHNPPVFGSVINDYVAANVTLI